MYISHELCTSVTNYVHESQTMYMGYLEMIYVWRDSVECCDGFTSCFWVTNYVHESHTVYMGYLELTYVWRDSVECSDVFKFCFCRTNYVRKSRTRFMTPVYMWHDSVTWLYHMGDMAIWHGSITRVTSLIGWARLFGRDIWTQTNQLY